MKRRDFLMASSVAGLAAACAPAGAFAGAETKAGARRAGAAAAGMPRLIPPAKPAKLNLSLQWPGIPGREINEKLDYLEKNGYAAFETPTGPWLLKNGEALAKALEGRRLFVATACGPSDFSYADKARRDAEVEKFLPQLEVLGMLRSVGLILCPMRRRPGLAFPELRNDFVNNTGRRLAEKAKACGTAIVLEPLQRAETPFLRQVADGASIARDVGPGCKVMGDFWHMSKEETSFMGAFLSGGERMVHVHIASLKHRKVPGTDGPADDYVDGFRGLKLIGYQGAVSFEGGFPGTAKDPASRHRLLVQMCGLLRAQWEQA